MIVDITLPGEAYWEWKPFKSRKDNTKEDQMCL